MARTERSPVRPVTAFRLALFVAALIGGLRPAAASTWIEQVQAELTCTGQADDAERLALDAAWLPTPSDARSVTAYFRGKPRDARHAQFRYMTMLAAIGWWADLNNDQRLRSEIYVTIGERARQYGERADAIVYRQVARCAQARLISAQLELDQPLVANRIAAELAQSYGAAVTPAQPVEDWPLLLALREIRLEPRARTGIESPLDWPSSQ